MAIETEVKNALTYLGQCYGKPSTWPSRVLSPWSEAFARIDPIALDDATKDWCETQNRCPSMAELLSYTRSWTARNGGGASNLRACKGCQMTGMRQMAWHRKEDGTHKVNTYAAACDCPKGRHYSDAARSGIRNWKDIGKQWRADPRTVDIHYTSVEAPTLASEQLFAPEVIERLRSQRGTRSGPIGGLDV